MTIKVITVDVARPPMTANAIGERREAPSPKPKHMGKSARMVVALVMIIGRIRNWAAIMIASSNGCPSSFRRLMASTRMIELFTAIPANMITPIKAIMFNVCPVSKKAQIHPTPAKGMVSRIVNGWRRDSNWAAITMYTNRMDRHKANPKPPNDSWRMVSSPVIVAVYLAGNSISSNFLSRPA